MNKTASPQCQVIETKRSDNSVGLDGREMKTSSLSNIKTKTNISNDTKTAKQLR